MNKCSHGLPTDKPCPYCEQDMRDVADWSAALDAVERSGLLPPNAKTSIPEDSANG